MTTAGWEDILDADEEIIWQGRPDGKMVWHPRNILTFIFGLTFASFAVFWMNFAASMGGVFWMFGLIHFSVGIGMAFGGMFKNTFMRRHSWYTLTNRRAFIARDLPIRGRVLKSYPIIKTPILELSGDNPVSVHFARETRSGNSRSYEVNVGFERIADGRDVYHQIRTIQREAE